MFQIKNQTPNKLYLEYIKQSSNSSDYKRQSSQILNKTQIQQFPLADMFNDWCTIESDPGVFTELVAKLGVPSVQVEEIYSMEDDQLITKLKPEIYGFIFLFKWTKNIEPRESLTIYDEDLFFARQVVNNACATQAILSILLNASVEVTGPLKEYLQFAKSLSSEDRGLVLSNSDQIRKIHNSFSRPQPFIFKEDKKAKKKADVYHFVSYVPHKGSLYELDGLQPGPILLGKYETKQQWIELAKKEIQNRILKYSEKEIRFNLLMVCQNLRNKKNKENAQLNQQKVAILKKLKTFGEVVDENFLTNYPDVAQSTENDPTTLQLRLQQIELHLQENHIFCQEQARKERQRKQQNIRRKHNYVPLIINMMKILAQKNLLNTLVEKAQEKKKSKAALGLQKK